MAELETAKDIQDKRPEDMKPSVGYIITAVVFIVPALALTLVGALVGNRYTAFGLATLWVGGLVAVSINIQQKRTFTVVERFGKLWTVNFAGFIFVIPYIDNVVLREKLLQKSVLLFDNIEIDFRGGSAPIKAVAWYQIGNPVDIDKGDFGKVREQILNYTYRVLDADRAQRVAEIFQGAFRTFLEQVDIETAQKEMERLAKDGTRAAEPALQEIGVYPFPDKGIVVSDITLSPNLIALREQLLRGEMDAKEAVARASAYWAPLAEMKKNLTQAGPAQMDLKDEDLLRLYLSQLALNTLPKIPAHVSLIASDMTNLQKMVTVGDITGGKEPKS